MCEQELGYPVEQLLTPLTRYLPQRPGEPFAIDNGAFAGFDAKKYRSLLAREYPRRHLCRFVTAPDVVGDAAATLALFEVWEQELRDWPVALVLQDGQQDLAVPWTRIRAVFVGGSTAFKVGPHAAALVREAKQRGLWVHAGRVNTPRRWWYFMRLGADSADGTGMSRYSHMRRRINQDRFQGRLF